MKLASIDIGSNSIHLVIVRAVRGQHLEIIDREKEMIRLGSVTLREHRLAPEAIDRAVTTLTRFKKMAEANKVDLIITTATAAVRESHNADEFINRVRAEVGLDVQLLPGVEEARLIALAVSEVTDFNNRRALMIDVGGGSTEFILTRGGEPELLHSMRIGAVRLTEKFITTDPPSFEERERLIANLRADLARVVWEIKKTGFDFVIGTAGTVENMVSAIVQAETARYKEAATEFEGFTETVTLDQIRKLNRQLARMTNHQRRRVLGIEKGRADIIIAGGLLLETILGELGATEIASCDWALREGVILNFLRNRAAQKRGQKRAQTASVTAVTQLESLAVVDESSLDVRTRSVLSVARRYGYDAPHSHHVAHLSARIFDDTREHHQLGDDDKKLLLYAALLHDLGYHIAHNNHHRHGLYLIKNAEMPGFTGSEIAMMATVVRYHRGSMPKGNGDSRSQKEHEDFYSLERPERIVVLKLAAILQIADGLDRAHRQIIKDVRCQISGDTVAFAIEAGGECDLEIWSAERKAVWFEDVFGVPVRFASQMIPASVDQPATAGTTSD
ncbi:MAG: exopolyphosphatase / guanosine-5-triphosphate,3-diphosphate pyrophosphatase [Blastocatellia bacterium]